MRQWGAYAVAACALATWASPASAVLTNKYTFNDGTANDSIGGQNGILVDNTGIAHYTGGTLDLSGNNNLGSNQNFALPATAGAFVDLPNGLFTGAVGGDGQATLEIWFTVQTNRNWAEVYSFGKSSGAEGESAGGGTTDYIALIPNSDPAGGTPDFRGATHSAAGAEIPLIGSPTPLTTGIKHHVVITFDALDTQAGANPLGTAKLYLNNGPAVVGGISPAIDTMSDINNWLGRSQWGDPLFDGFIDEFRVYDNALSAAQVSTSFTTGPDPSPTPTLVIDRATGGMSIANQTGAAIQLKGYSITSAGGALNSTTWTSIDADNTFDNNGGWTKSSQTDTLLAESVTIGPNLDGGSLAAAATRAIGTPWRKSPTEDVAFSYTLGDGTTGLGFVQFTGNGGVPFKRSDLNGDGLINPADWAAFLPNSFTSFPTATTVGAYLKGDLDGDKDSDYVDFLRFKADYIAANGPGAFEALGAVPEPASLALAALAVVGFAGTRRHRRVA